MKSFNLMSIKAPSPNIATLGIKASKEWGEGIQSIIASVCEKIQQFHKKSKKAEGMC